MNQNIDKLILLGESNNILNNNENFIVLKKKIESHNSIVIIAEQRVYNSKEHLKKITQNKVLKYLDSLFN